MKTGNEFQETVYGYWARRFGCDRKDFIHPGTLVIIEEELAEIGKTHRYHIDQMSLVRIAPSLARQASLPDGYNKDLGSLTVNALQALIQAEVESIFLDWFLDAKDLQCFSAGNEFITRRLDTQNDNPYLLSLYETCTEAELEKAAIYRDEPDPVMYGMFDGEQIVAYAGHRYWDEVIADIGVLIHPEYRGRGLGKAIVSALCEWCIQNDIVPMYRVFSDHVHSWRIAEALGFKKLVVIETLKAKEEKGTA